MTASHPRPALGDASTSPGSATLAAATWRERERAHADRADALTAEYRAAHARGERHAIDDFLFTYYPVKPSVLRRWQPGVGVRLEDAAEWAGRRWYRSVAAGPSEADAAGSTASVALAPELDAVGSPASIAPSPEPDAGDFAGSKAPSPELAGPADVPALPVEVDAAAFVAERGDLIGRIEDLLTAVLHREPRFACFGLHEWAMVYRDDEHRHPIPLRLGQAATDAVVESHRISCSHYDAFRFFTPPARPLNLLQPTRATQCALDQAGCLHANMDLLKWALKLGPLVPGELLLDAFTLAREIRWTDMQASPYDVSDFKVPAIAIETPAGKDEYVRRQRDYAARAQPLRARLLDVIARARAAAAAS